MTATTTPRTLLQRIADVQGKIETVKATGHNQFNANAISIGDVESALRKPLADAGIVTRWSYVELAQIEKGLWRSHLKVTVCSTDVESDLFEDEWIDIGGNPMAATSFARKGYLKALFHFAEESDEKGRVETKSEPTNGHSNLTPGAGAQPSSTVARPTPAPSSTVFAARSACPLCKELGLTTVQGKEPQFWPAKSGPHAGSLQCNGILEGGGYANHLPPIPADDRIYDNAEIPM